MSVGTVYDTAYRGDFNLVKVRLDADADLVKTSDSVSTYVPIYFY